MAADSRLAQAHARIAELEGLIKAWQEASLLSDSSGDPDSIAPHHLEAARQADDARIAELEAVVAKLPKTADGVPAYKDMPVWCVMPDGSIYETELGWYCTLGAAFARDLAARRAGYRLSNGVWRDVGVPVEHCYSTPEAAEAAKEGK